MFDFIPISTRDVLGLLLTNILEFYSYIHNAPSIRTQFFLCLPYFIQSGDRTCLEALFHYKSALFQMSSFSTLFSFLNLQHLIITYLFGVAWQHAPLVSLLYLMYQLYMSADYLHKGMSTSIVQDRWTLFRCSASLSTTSLSTKWRSLFSSLRWSSRSTEGREQGRGTQ